MEQNRTSGALVVGLVACAAAWLGYLSVNSFVLWYDDEGYVLLGLQRYLRGEPLYAKVHATFGPAFFQLRALLFQLLPLNHDANRLLALVEWLLGSALLGVIAARLTRRPLLGLVAAGLGFLLMEVTSKEPGHAQSFAFLLVTLGLVGLTFWPDRARGWALAGGAVAVLVLTKINLGAYLGLGILLTLLETQPWGAPRARRALRAIALPLFALGLIGVSSPRENALLLALALGAVVLYRAPPSAPDARPLRLPLVAGGAFALVLAASLGAELVVHGLSLSDLRWGLFGQHQRFAVRGSDDFPLFGLALPALACLGAGFWHRRRAAGRADLQLLLALGALALVVVFLAAGVDLELRAGEQAPGGAFYLWALAPGLVWLLAPPGGGFGARLFANATWTLLLVPYPVAGSQLAYPAALVTCLAVVSAARALDDDEALRPWARRLTLALVTVALALILARGAWLQLRYSRGMDPGLPGASNLRLEPGEARALHALTEHLRARCTTFVSFNGFNSLYLWTGKDAPTPYNTTLWTTYLRPEHQRALAQVLEQTPGACYAQNLRVVPSRDGRISLPPEPLGPVIERRFTPERQIGAWVILRRDD